ncbi:MAG: hypothetical protein M0C28_37715 [Candidatus Moduliflexus flocculans]|nr:hypothetical protein [Candidatus Moduliflexus flocculans]
MDGIFGQLSIRANIPHDADGEGPAERDHQPRPGKRSSPTATSRACPWRRTAARRRWPS